MASMIAASPASLAARARVAPGSTSFRARAVAAPAARVASASRRSQRLVVRAEDGTFCFGLGHVLLPLLFHHFLTP